MARPTKLTPEVQKDVVTVIQAGNYRYVAAEYAGVSAKVFWEWMQRGKREKKGIYHEFRKAVLKAERAAEIRMVTLVSQAAAEDAKHAEWFLERKYPERWGRKLAVGGIKDAPPIQTEATEDVTFHADPDLAPFLAALCQLEPSEQGGSAGGGVPADGARQPVPPP